MRLILDVTQTSSVGFISGISRVVRDFAHDNATDILLVRLDERTGHFRFVDEIPPIVSRDHRGRLASVRMQARRGYRAIREMLAPALRVPLERTPGIKRLVTWFFNRFLAESYGVRSRASSTSAIWDPQPGDVLLVMEVVMDPDHQSAISAVSANGARLAMYVHDMIPLSHPELFPSDLAKRQTRFVGYLDLVRSAEVVFANSQQTAEEFAQSPLVRTGPTPTRLTVCYPPRPKVRHVFNPPAAASDGDALRILGVGGLSRRKNFVVVARAVRLLQAQSVPVSLTLVGRQSQGAESELLRALDDLGDCVQIVESVSDDFLERLIAEHDLVVVPSLAEGFGLPVLESIARGRPVVTSDIPVFRELQPLLGFAVAAADDPREWADAILDSWGRAVPALPDDVFPESWRSLHGLLAKHFSLPSPRANNDGSATPSPRVAPWGN